MRRYLVLAAAAALVGTGIVQAQTPAAEEPRVRVKADHPGRTIFERQCASCHGAGPGDDGSPMLPGTMALAGKYQGRLPAALELRSDLSAETIRFFVRNGSGTMPMFRKAELSDADIEAVAGYLKLTAEANSRDPL